MKAKRLLISFLFFIVLIVLVGVATARRTQEAGFDAFVNVEQEISHVEELNRDVVLSLPRLPENKDRFETTPAAVPRGSAVPSVVPKSPEDTSGSKIVLQPVPFTSQAPTGRWVDARFQDGCEEASVLMAIRWAEEGALTVQEAEREILAISKYEQDNFGGFHDTSAEDTAERIVKGYFKYSNVEVQHHVDTGDIRRELELGRLVLIPLDGRELGNPYYTPPGPDHHMLVVIGYDPVTDEFITNDPGTRRGKGYRYASEVLLSALRDYPTGNHENFPGAPRTALISVGKE